MNCITSSWKQYFSVDKRYRYENVLFLYKLFCLSVTNTDCYEIKKAGVTIKIFFNNKNFNKINII